MNTMYTAASDVDFDNATGNGDRWERIEQEENERDAYDDFLAESDMDAHLVEASLVPGPTDQNLEEWFSNDPRNQ